MKEITIKIETDDEKKTIKQLVKDFDVTFFAIEDEEEEKSRVGFK